MSGELLLTILSSVAQQESETISSHVKLGFKMKMQRGELIGFNGCLGYDYNPIDKTISVNDEEAKVVRYIFERYRDGLGSQMIAKELEQQEFKTKIGRTKWHEFTVRGILRNEKYKGDILMGKTFTLDPISHRRLINMGEENKYYINEHHEAIVSLELWNDVEQMLNERSIKYNRGKRQGRYSAKYTFSSKLYCGFCNKVVTRRRWYANSPNSKNVWQCSSYIKHGKKECPECKAISEDVIKKCFLEMYRKLSKNNEKIIQIFLEHAEKSILEYDSTDESEAIKTSILRLEKKRDKIIDMKIDGAIDEFVYKEKYNQIQNEIKELDNKLSEISLIKQSRDDVNKRIQEFKRLLQRNESTDKFDDNIFKCLIDRVIVGEKDDKGNNNPYILNFVFKSGENVRYYNEEKNSKKNETKCSLVANQSC